MDVAVFGKKFEQSFRPHITEFFNQLIDYKANIYVYQPFLEFLKTEVGCNPPFAGTFIKGEEIGDNIKFMFSVGGDGTFLETVPFIKGNNIPVIGINSGRLGFLANIAGETISSAVKALFEGKYKQNQRTLLEVTINEKQPAFFNNALNDITVQKTDNTLINVKMFINGEFVTTYWTDGVIVATPTGSTAYSLSVGGPIVLPGTNNFIVSPIASHNLSVRPLVVSDDVQIDLVATSRNNKFILTVDNRNRTLDEGCKITLKKSSFTVTVLDFEESTYFTTLRNKLMWGADKRN